MHTVRFSSTRTTLKYLRGGAEPWSPGTNEKVHGDQWEGPRGPVGRSSGTSGKVRGDQWEGLRGPVLRSVRDSSCRASSSEFSLNLCAWT